VTFRRRKIQSHPTRRIEVECFSIQISVAGKFGQPPVIRRAQCFTDLAGFKSPTRQSQRYGDGAKSPRP
jgi:hypothetical protein